MPRSPRPPQPAAGADLSWDQVLAWRLDRQHLRRRLPAQQLGRVVHDLCGLHAQVMSSALLTLWARVDHLPADAIDDLLWQQRRLVKTWAMRGTLHLLPSDELAFWTAAEALTKPRYLTGAWQKAFGVTAAEMDAIAGVLPDILANRTLSRQELASEVAAALARPDLVAALSHSWGAVLKPFAFTGLLCFAPGTGNTVRFTSPRTWLPATGDAPPPDAVAAGVIRRYLQTYGPATGADLRRWMGMLSAAQWQRQLTALGDEVTPVTIAGAPAWSLTADLPALAAASPDGTVRLLPAFDQYLVTMPRDEPGMLPTSHKGRVYRPQGWFSPVVVADGRIIGTWRHSRPGSRLLVEIAPFAPLSRSLQHAVAAEAARLGEVLPGELDLAFLPPAAAA